MSHIVGGAPSSGSGLIGKFSKDQIIKTYHATNSAKGSVVDEFWTQAFLTSTRKSGTSKFLCQAVITIGMYTNTGNQDGANPGFRWRHTFNNGAGTATTTDIVSNYVNDLSLIHI